MNNQALDHLRIVHEHTPPDAYICIARKSIGLQGRLGYRFFKRKYEDDIIRCIDNWRNEYHVYMRVTALKYIPQQGRGNEDITIGSGCLWADIDIYGDSKEEYIKFLKEEYICTPSYIVDSGRGLHAYWLLTEFCYDLIKIKSKNKWLKDDLNTNFGLSDNDAADPCYDLARLMRIPGTYNMKDDNRVICHAIL